ncbi:ribosome recycling factor [Spirochaeta cellobiosiphila]|uniref:ribosome recycling factor n=1 Tax=Spirochaeta cellobiosiphila TaxID=504483 RepID=UPI00041F6C24|nr:ribosome recycling factor [Spirochaeta cellobiosiphila]
MDAIKKEAQNRMDKSIRNLKEEFNAIRTGRASASLFDKVMVDYYGTPTPLNQVASISVPEARLIAIQPWDKGSLGAIEKAIFASELGLTPANDGKVIRINIPPLTEDRRKELVKIAKNTAENNRIAIRNIRRDINESIKKSQKDGEITEDAMKASLDDIQNVTNDFIKKIDGLLSEKEKEIMEI